MGSGHMFFFADFSERCEQFRVERGYNMLAPDICEICYHIVLRQKYKQVFRCLHNALGTPESFYISILFMLHGDLQRRRCIRMRFVECVLLSYGSPFRVFTGFYNRGAWRPSSQEDIMGLVMDFV